MALIERLDGRPRAVVLRALGLGDALTGVPALRALSAALPELRLTVAMPAPLAPLLELVGLDADVLPRTGFEQPPPSGTAVLAINLHGSGPQSHRWLQALRPERMIAFAQPAAGVDGPAWRADEHERDRWCRLVSDALDIPADPRDIGFTGVRYQPGSGPDDYAVVHAGAASPARRWPVGRFAAVVRHLLDRGLQVFLTGTPAERARIDELLRSTRADARVVPATGTDLPQLARLVAGARVLVCGDTGVAHVASATGTPSVVLFGPTSPSAWGPPEDGPHRALWRGELGDPHGDEVDPGLLAVEVPEVLSAVDEVVGVSAPAGPAPSGWPGGTSGRRSASGATSTAAPAPVRR